MTLLYLIGLLIFVWSLLMAVIVVPDDWDAWAIWGAKAKVLALAQGPLENVIYFGHQDYPLLWPAVWAFSGWCSGGWEEHWSRGWGRYWRGYSKRLRAGRNYHFPTFR